KIIGGFTFTGYIKDITEQKKYEEELQENNQNLTSQNWLRENISKIMELTQGATNLRVMSDLVIAQLALLLEAGHAVLYIKENSEELELLGSYAFKERKNVSGKIRIGEGLVGQCAKEGKAILLTQVPSDYIQITSALGEKKPFSITVLPILFENDLIGVLEFASFKEFTPIQQELLDQVTLSLGIVINNINNTAKTQLLLEETQRQSEELQSQQEELQASNENLEEQTQQLQNSENILKAQREELTKSNEQLAQKSKSLESQKAQIELARKDLEIKTEDLSLASKYKSEFLANMSHELRTPLNSYLLLSKSLLDNKKGNLSEDQLEDLQIIYDGGGELLHLINDIMDLSKVEAGKLHTHIEDVDPKIVCVNIANIFKGNAKNKDLQFKAYCEDNIPSIIQTDSQRLEQILKNFLSNSFKFTPTGSIELKVHLPDDSIEYSSNILHPKNTLAFSVIDTGIGISKDKQREIFEAFQQEDGSTSRKYGGTGLGLAISKELAKKLGGEIHLESTKDKGSIFTLYLPVLNDQDSNEENTEKIEEVISAKNETVPKEEPIEKLEEIGKLEEILVPSHEEHFVPDDRHNIQEDDNAILIIDDDEKFAKILLNIVRGHGYKGLVAGDGKNGLYLALEHTPNGIILDLGLPDMDGNKVLEQLKFHSSTKDIPVHIISGRDDVQSSLESGAISYLLKPASKEDIEVIISKIAKAHSKESLTALVVDNDLKSQKTISQLLNNENIQTKSVKTGKLAIENLSLQGYDFVVIDIDLPDISGFDVLEKINNDDSVILPHIIIYTQQELSVKQRHQLQKYSATVIQKDSESTDKQLDEALLFLQSMSSKMSLSDKKTMYSLDEESDLLAKRKILLVDDDMRNTFALSKHLQEVGLIVYEADNGQTALSKLSEQKDIELILMDIMMPVMDGYEAMQSIRKMGEFKDIPIIALTAKAMPQDRVKCIEAGASDYLTKPVNFEKLISMLKVWLFKK
ncbi:MAG: response regulator, partial [Campylobacteraceae bacterium]|nr:response regulator [Campylobacteraceae bacterium]